MLGLATEPIGTDPIKSELNFQACLETESLKSLDASGTQIQSQLGNEDPPSVLVPAAAKIAKAAGGDFLLPAVLCPHLHQGL